MLVLYFCLLLSCAGFVCHGSQPSKKLEIEFLQESVLHQLEDYLEFRNIHKYPVIIERRCGYDYSNVPNCLQVKGITYNLKDIIKRSDEFLNTKQFDLFFESIVPVMAVKEELNKARSEKWEYARWEHYKNMQPA